jgi:hypothetical protein
MYTSFKHGEVEGIRDGRLFSDPGSPNFSPFCDIIRQ